MPWMPVAIAWNASGPLVDPTATGIDGGGPPISYRTWSGFGERLNPGDSPAALSTTIGYCAVRVLLNASVTDNVTRKMPAAVGVPEIAPALLIDRPGGMSDAGVT